jgi:sulfopyruvate decarboxylase subunit beta
MSAGRMRLRAAVETVYRARGERDIVVTTMGAAREWLELGAGPLDLVFVPSAMGHATSIGLGLALAQPDRRVFVCNGDGSMLMNLGSLVTIAAAAPPNLTVAVFDNGVYEVTGGQPTPRAASGTDFAAIARGAGFTSSHRFGDLAEFDGAFSRTVAAPGPHFFALDVEPVLDKPGPKSPGKASVRAAEFMRALGATR